VNEAQWYADHGEDSKDMFFWDLLGFVFLDDICQALVALFHNYARKFVIIFDNIFDLDNHWVIESS